VANGNPKKGGGGGGRDVVMESRHLFGVFLGIVVLCGVFFTLGYVMGRTQYDSSVRAAVSAPRPAASPAANPPAPPKSAVPVPAASDWNFYRATESKPAAEALKPALPATKPPEPATAAKPTARGAAKPLWKAPLIPRGAIVLQVAALTRESDALALAEALQQKEYPAFALAPTSDNLYRVQVGPYADVQSAEMARRSLERDGFKAIAKR
jgi:cell division septation protein DedD